MEDQVRSSPPLLLVVGIGNVPVVPDIATAAVPSAVVSFEVVYSSVVSPSSVVGVLAGGASEEHVRRVVIVFVSFRFVSSPQKKNVPSSFSSSQRGKQKTKNEGSTSIASALVVRPSGALTVV